MMWGLGGSAFLVAPALLDRDVIFGRAVEEALALSALPPLRGTMSAVLATEDDGVAARRCWFGDRTRESLELGRLAMRRSGAVSGRDAEAAAFSGDALSALSCFFSFEGDRWRCCSALATSGFLSELPLVFDDAGRDLVLLPPSTCGVEVVASGDPDLFICVPGGAESFP